MIKFKCSCNCEEVNIVENKKTESRVVSFYYDKEEEVIAPLKVNNCKFLGVAVQGYYCRNCGKEVFFEDFKFED